MPRLGSWPEKWTVKRDEKVDGPTFRVYGLFAHRHTIESGQSNGSETVEKAGRNPLDRPFCLVLYFFRSLSGTDRLLSLDPCCD